MAYICYNKDSTLKTFLLMECASVKLNANYTDNFAAVNMSTSSTSTTHNNYKSFYHILLGFGGCKLR